jgi:hypothetical protein
VLEARGYEVLRFWDNDVLRDLDAVLQVVVSTVERLRSGLAEGPHPYPLPAELGEGSEPDS